MLHIITLHWNKKDILSPLKKSLLNALENIDFNWYIKDNASNDGSIEELKSWNHNNIHVLYYKDNKQNYSQGMNLLFKEANPKDDDMILTLNNDVIIKNKTSIANMIELLQKPNIGLVGAKLNYSNSNKIQHNGILFHQYNGLPYHYRAGLTEDEYDRQNRYYPIITGALSLFKAEVFRNCFKNKSGTVGFCEDYHWAFDDCDLGMRIGCFLKQKIACCGNVNIEHEESSSLKKNPVNKLFMKHNAQLFLNNWHKYINPTLEEKYSSDKNYNLIE